MGRATLILILALLFAVPIPLAIATGFFVDYTDPNNRGLLYLHPGYYYLAHKGMITDTGDSTSFRGGGPGFGK